MSPASSANITEAITHLLTQVVNNKKDDVSKHMMKNIKTFDGTNRTEFINWLSQMEATSKFSTTSFRELVCQGMAPSMPHILSELSPLSTDQEIKDVILANYSDIPSTAEVATKLQSMQMPLNEPLVSFNVKIQGHPLSRIWPINKQAVRQNNTCRICQETTTKHQRKAA